MWIIKIIHLDTKQYNLQNKESFINTDGNEEDLPACVR